MSSSSPSSGDQENDSNDAPSLPEKDPDVTTFCDAVEKAGGKVPYGEESRKYRRTVYSHEDWVRHRSDFRITKNLSGMLTSGVLRQLGGEVGLVVAFAAFVAVWNAAAAASGGAAGGSAVFENLPELRLPVLPFTLSSPCLALLLVFRTNSSYSRWWEARTKWGSVINHCNNVVRMSAAYVDASSSNRNGQTALNRVCRASWVLPRTLMNRLSGEREDGETYAKEIRAAFGNNDDPTGFADHVLSEATAPNLRLVAAFLELTEAIDELPIELSKKIEIDKSAVVLNDCVGSCESRYSKFMVYTCLSVISRAHCLTANVLFLHKPNAGIFTSPVPLVYTRHTARFLSIWLLLLPLALYGTFVADNASPAIGVAESGNYLFAMAVISLFLFGIEELAITLEEPFSILPMQGFCDKIRKSTEAMRDRAIYLSSRRSNKR